MSIPPAANLCYKERRERKLFMPKKKTRVPRHRRTQPDNERLVFPVLIILVLGVILLGLFSYTAMLVAGSAIFVGFFGWRRWKQRTGRGAK